MRIAFLADVGLTNAFYRSVWPIEQLCRRGHEGRQLSPRDYRGVSEIVAWCDVLHIHRFCDETVLRLVQGAKQRGAAIVWDEDDDLGNLSPKHIGYKHHGGLQAERRRICQQKLFALTDLVTTPSSQLAQVLSAAGASSVSVIENFVPDQYVVPRRIDPSQVVVGWHAASEHRHDLDYLPVAGALRDLLDSRPDVLVRTIGIDLGLVHDRYEYAKPVAYDRLLRELASFDVGLAPLASEMVFNHARSNVKLKEYAAMGVPWLASPVGPYVGMCQREGGRLVANDGWSAALGDLVSSARARRKLAGHAERWGQRQLLSHNIEAWESSFAEAIERSVR